MRFPREITIAFIFVVLGGGLSLSSISTILRERNDIVEELILTIPTSEINIYQGTRCIAYLQTTYVTKTEGNTIDFSLHIPFEVKESIQGSVTFNDLGQLITSEAHIVGTSPPAMVATLGIDPIHIVLKGSPFQKAIKMEFDIPGPILSQSEQKILHIKIPRKLLSKNQTQNQNVLDLLKLSFRSEPEAQCRQHAGQVQVPPELSGLGRMLMQRFYKEAQK